MYLLVTIDNAQTELILDVPHFRSYMKYIHLGYILDQPHVDPASLLEEENELLRKGGVISSFRCARALEGIRKFPEVIAQALETESELVCEHCANDGRQPNNPIPLDTTEVNCHACHDFRQVELGVLLETILRAGARNGGIRVS